ncbi:MAG TPA: DUF4242 domain-containing protein [Actinomycetota bacterium]
MPLFMDVHTLGGSVSEAEAAAAHAKDLETQGAYGVSFKEYWVDHKQGKIFCLAEGPDAKTVGRVHEEGHGMVADAIFEVAHYA